MKTGGVEGYKVLERNVMSSLISQTIVGTWVEDRDSEKSTRYDTFDEL